MFVQRVSAEPRGELQGRRAVRGRVARQETEVVPLLLRHLVAGHGHRREDVQHRRRRSQVSDRQSSVTVASRSAAQLSRRPAGRRAQYLSVP